MVQEQSCNGGACNENGLRNFPAKQYGKTYSTDQNCREIVDGTSRQNDYRARNRAGGRGGHTSHERVQLRVLRPSFVGGREQHNNQVDRKKIPSAAAVAPATPATR